ncbi:radical SAM protein [candidate division KSB1 bacterium]|nr:radical SAM protein [candidate division KSB1 bacterium]
MRCIYCYASAGENSPKFLQWEVAKAAIDLVAANAKKLGVKHFSVGFHGGGEPTLDWRLFTRCVEYSKKVSEEIGIKVLNSVASNAVFNNKQMDWILKNLNSMSISLDGPSDVQNYQRPLVNGKPSYDIVFKNLKRLDEAGFNYGLRSTITDYNVRRMSEIVEHFLDNFKTKQIHFEPLFFCGRCHTFKINAPNYRMFMREFLKAIVIADQHKVRLAYSGLRLGGLTSTFCGACGSNFSVTPFGDVTSCFEVTEKEDPRSAIFFYGKWQDAKKEFDIQEDKLDYLRSFHVQNISYCRDCLAKWHCAGDCLAKVAADADVEGERDSNRCRLNQEITKRRIMQFFVKPPKDEKVTKTN